MSQIPANYYDGVSAKTTPVIVHLHLPGILRITGLPAPEGEATYTLGEVNISERIGNTPRSIYLPGGAKCETPNNIEIDEFLKSAGKKSFEGMVHRLENKFAYAIVALTFTAISLWLFVEYGIPELAKRAAFAAPASISSRLGSEGLTILDKVIFKPSELSEETKAEFIARLSEIKMRIEDAPELKIVFRKGGVVGANAFALPNGTIVFTDELIEMSEDDLEIVAIMAHEIGHVTGRHSLRMILQNSTVALIISSITGDITSITALSATIPTILVEAKYSKGFEREADTYALTYLNKAGIDTVHFANILERMSEARGGGDNGKFSYLSSHPETEERVERFK